MDRPIIFSTPMVRALLDGRKTMTRRLAERNTKHYEGPSPWQRVAVGDRLWVREGYAKTPVGIAYLADGAAHYGAGGGIGRPSIHQPRWASRLTLTVTETKIERLQDIGYRDAIEEGLMRGDPLPEIPESKGTIWSGGVGDLNDPAAWTRDPTAAFAILWESIHGAGSWEANPEVVALRFAVERGNIDAKEPA